VLTLGYDEMTTTEIVKQLIPEGIEIVTSFEIIGHIAHLNLTRPCLPYRFLIGQVILDKNKNISTVVNKTGDIDTVFRTFQMEVIAGLNELKTQVRESGCKFEFDFTKVYWNSRLGTEHERLVKGFKPGEIIVDMFCGVGPFAVPAAKKGCIVYANDLNPESYASLVHNVKINKCQPNTISCFNMDGRQFIKDLVIGTDGRPPLRKIDHVIMNLPASAVSFLDVFLGLFDNTTPPTDLPTVYCYGFSKTQADPVVDILQQAEKYFGIPIPNPVVTNVRTVSTFKYMMKIVFKVPQSVCTRQAGTNNT